jgi:hypothetical protein
MFVLIIVGVLVWAANTYIPMAQPIRIVFNVVVLLLVMVWLLNMFGFSPTVTVPARR